MYKCFLKPQDTAEGALILVAWLCTHFFSTYFFYFHFTEEFVIGRVIKAMNNNWHPECFLCQICETQLADTGFVKNRGRYDLVTSVRSGKLIMACSEF